MKRVPRSLFLFLAVAGLAIASCSEESLLDREMGNKPPLIELTSGPPEGSTTDYRVHFFWSGSDPDGQIGYFEYLITDNESGVFDPADTVSTPGDYKWIRIDATDGEFLFSADQVADSTGLNDDDVGPYKFIRSHTFFIRAVDNRGARSVAPAYRSFTAQTLSPVVDITIPSGDFAPIPPIATFKWTATDFVNSIDDTQPPMYVRWIMAPTSRFGGTWEGAIDYIRDNPDADEWYEWQPYDTISGNHWTTPPLDLGQYVFAVQAMDEAGAVTPVFDLKRNMRRLMVGSDGWPVLTVYNEFMGTCKTASFHTPPVIFDLPSALPIQFEFSATAEHYGGIIVGYRYAWDILDPADDDQWGEWTPFVGAVARTEPKAFFFGTHTILIEVMDNSGFKARFEARINMIPFTMENDLLLVDDWAEGSTCFTQNKGASPCDNEHDLFWEQMLADVADFSSAVHVFETGPVRNEVPITVIARYKSIIWVANGDESGTSNSYLDKAITFVDGATSTAEKTKPNPLAMYMAAGGRLLVCGNQVMTLVSDETKFRFTGGPVYPLIFRYELGGDQDGSYDGPDNKVGEFGVGEDSFAYRECCLNVLDQSFVQDRRRLRGVLSRNDRCSVDQLRDNDIEADAMRSALPAVLANPFPQLELRPEVTASGRFFETAGLAVDIYNPRYFNEMTTCDDVTEIDPPRDCFEPIYTNGCTNPNSVLYDAPVAFWTSARADRIPYNVGGADGRSAVWGFHPVYFEPGPVKTALEIILFDEWQLRRR